MSTLIYVLVRFEWWRLRFQKWLQRPLPPILPYLWKFITERYRYQIRAASDVAFFLFGIPNMWLIVIYDTSPEGYAAGLFFLWIPGLIFGWGLIVLWETPISYLRNIDKARPREGDCPDMPSFREAYYLSYFTGYTTLWMIIANAKGDSWFAALMLLPLIIWILIPVVATIKFLIRLSRHEVDKYHGFVQKTRTLLDDE